MIECAFTIASIEFKVSYLHIKLCVERWQCFSFIIVFELFFATLYRTDGVVQRPKDLCKYTLSVVVYSLI